jgi:hypothetical protein
MDNRQEEPKQAFGLRVMPWMENRNHPSERKHALPQMPPHKMTDDTTFREPWDREPTIPWVPTCDIIRRIMAAPVVCPGTSLDTDSHTEKTANLPEPTGSQKLSTCLQESQALGFHLTSESYRLLLANLAFEQNV